MSNSSLQEYEALAKELLHQYRSVDRAVDYVVASKGSTSANETLEVIKKLLDSVKKTESKVQPIRDSLIAEGATLPESTQKVIDETVKIVTTLIPRIGALEKDAVEARERLAPVIREGVRAAKMKSAYSKQHSR